MTETWRSASERRRPEPRRTSGWGVVVLGALALVAPPFVTVVAATEDPDCGGAFFCIRAGRYALFLSLLWVGFFAGCGIVGGMFALASSPRRRVVVGMALSAAAVAATTALWLAAGRDAWPFAPR